MSTNPYLLVAALSVLVPLIFLIPLWYAAFTYSTIGIEPVTRWKFAFISLFLTYGVAIFIGVLLIPVEIAAIKLSSQLDEDGWYKIASFLSAFDKLSQLLWLVILLVIGFLMPARVKKFVVTVRSHVNAS